jgi:serine/threonine protein kinase
VFHSPLDFLALSALRHHHIVRLDYGWVSGGTGLWVSAQEYLHGGDLLFFMSRWWKLAPADMDRRRGPNPATSLTRSYPWGVMPLANIRSVLLQVLLALEFCHAMGFGSTIRQPFAPHLADVYSMGIMAVECLVGFRPFEMPAREGTTTEPDFDRAIADKGAAVAAWKVNLLPQVRRRVPVPEPFLTLVGMLLEPVATKRPTAHEGLEFATALILRADPLFGL